MMELRASNVITLNIARTFDSVDHKIPVRNPQYFGIEQPLIRWIIKLLFDIDGVLSESESVTPDLLIGSVFYYYS